MADLHRVDEVADFMDLKGINNQLLVFYSFFRFTPFENGDVMIGSKSDPRICLIPAEEQSDAFRAALKRKLDIHPPPHYGRTFPLGSDSMLAKHPPKMMIMSRAEYSQWTLRRMTHAISHGNDPVSNLFGPCQRHTKRKLAEETDPGTIKTETTTESKARKKRKKKKKKGAAGTEASTPANGEV